MVTARRGQQEITRNSSYFKRIDDRHMRAPPIPERDDDFDSGIPAPTPIVVDSPHTPVIQRSPAPMIMPQTPRRSIPVATPTKTPRFARRLTMPSVPPTPRVPTTPIRQPETPVVHERPRIKQKPVWQKDYHMY